MRKLCVWVGSSWLVIAIVWSCIGLCFVAGCLDAPIDQDPEPASRIIVAWDPRACGKPHRVVLELADEAGTPAQTSAPCAIGSLTLDAPLLGFYSGRIYSWIAGEPIRSVVDLRLEVDAPVVRWAIATPP